jgi:hypothetical protein
VLPKGGASVVKTQSANTSAELKDEVISVPNTPREEKVAMPARVASMIRGFNKKPFHAILVQDLAVTGAANTAYTSVTPLQVSNGNDYTSFTNLFDEVKLNSIDIDYLDSYELTTDTSTGSAKFFAWAYDPVNSGVYGSTAAVCEAEQHRLGAILPGYTQYPPPGLGGIKTCKLPRWHIRIKAGAQTNPSISNEVATGLWHATTDSNAIDGYLKPYVPALGSGNIYHLRMLIRFNVTFRSRT